MASRTLPPTAPSHQTPQPQNYLPFFSSPQETQRHLFHLLLMDFPTPKPKNHFSDDPLMPLTLSHRSPHLLTNCDLPPPLQLFTPLFFEDENPSVLRALRLSQSRAREAEERVEFISAKSARLASMLLDESVLLSAHRRWVMMLESEVSVLNKRLSQTAKDDGDSAGEFAWCIALALCLGIAGVGFALGRCLFSDH